MSALGGIWRAAIWPPGWTVHHVDETGSTNADLLAAVESGEAGDRTVLATDHQTHGRGRLDRRWDAPPGVNLLVSMVCSPVPAVAVEATHRVGLAVSAVVARRRPDAVVGLKWPNDVLLDDRKVAGILAQLSPAADAIVIGFGVNVGWAPDGAARLSDGAGRSAVAPSSDEAACILAEVLAEFDALPADIGALYAHRLLTLGRTVRVELPTSGGAPSAVTGRAVGVDETGRLLVIDQCAITHRFDVGDVVHVRPA